MPAIGEELPAVDELYGAEGAEAIARENIFRERLDHGV